MMDSRIVTIFFSTPLCVRVRGGWWGGVKKGESYFGSGARCCLLMLMFRRHKLGPASPRPFVGRVHGRYSTSVKPRIGLVRERTLFRSFIGH